LIDIVQTKHHQIHTFQTESRRSGQEAMAIPVHLSMRFNVMRMAPKSLVLQPFRCTSTSGKILCTTDLLTDAEFWIPNPQIRCNKNYKCSFKHSVSFEQTKLQASTTPTKWQLWEFWHEALIQPAYAPWLKMH
jgi:hypothetical protein